MDELTTVWQELEDKDVMLSTMLGWSTVETEEKEDIARELVAQDGKEAVKAKSQRGKR